MKEKTSFVNWKLFRAIVKEFIMALGNAHTYNIRKNWYVVFGILWGIPVPIVTIGMSLYHRNMAVSIQNIMFEIQNHPMEIFFLMHPILFGIVFGAMGTVRDEKEKAREKFERNLIELNEKLKDTNKKLRELDQLKDNFLSMVSHELWNPLTTMQGYVSLIKQGGAGEINSQQKEILKIVEEQVEHLDHLIEELMDISKIETGKFKVKIERLDIGNLETKVLNSFKQAADDKEITLKNEVSSKLPDVSADKTRIIQVLTNLLGNAIKFTPERGIVSVSAQEKEDTVEISISDNGIGIPEDKVGRIFDKFYQADSTNKRKYCGCGLGLAIVRHIIELHGSRIGVESKIGKGSRFFFELKKI